MKLQATFSGGRLVFSPVALAIAAQHFAGRRLIVEIETERAIRTIRQNSRWWGVIIPLMQHYLDNHPSREGLLPLSKWQTHEVTVRAFAGEEMTALGPCRVETKTMTTKQHAVLQETAEKFLGEKGYQIPAGPEETVEQAIKEATE